MAYFKQAEQSRTIISDAATRSEGRSEHLAVADSNQLGPLLAGAWARGVADTLEMLEQGAILLDAAGGVLYASPRAISLLDGHAQLVSNHIVARDGTVNASFEEIIAAALRGESPQFQLQTGSRDLTIRAMPAARTQGSSVQLLKAVLAIA